MGYHRSGFEVTGVDIVNQPNYPFRFVQTNALTAKFLCNFDAIHASPPCQNYCWGTAWKRAEGKIYPDLIESTRELLIESGKPYVIENVPNAPLQNPTYLEGTMFGLGVIRRRCFETSGWWLPQPMYINRKPPIMQQSKRDPRVFIQKSAYCSVAGNGADGWSCRLEDWKTAMGIDWMHTRGEVTQAIPPAYTEYVGQYLMAVVCEGI
jgi:DNA (cytosine-5)-methyltransferase 1